eukprot:3508312-Prorocentrum_lima.AAC.1
MRKKQEHNNDKLNKTPADGPAQETQTTQTSTTQTTHLFRNITTPWLGEWTPSATYAKPAMGRQEPM